MLRKLFWTALYGGLAGLATIASRRMKPSLIKARAKGEAPTSQRPGSGSVAPSGPQLGKRPAPKSARLARGGPNPWLVAGVALAAGIFLAMWIDWRGDAHPRA